MATVDSNTTPLVAHPSMVGSCRKHHRLPVAATTSGVGSTPSALGTWGQGDLRWEQRDGSGSSEREGKRRSVGEEDRNSLAWHRRTAPVLGISQRDGDGAGSRSPPRTGEASRGVPGAWKGGAAMLRHGGRLPLVPRLDWASTSQHRGAALQPTGVQQSLASTTYLTGCLEKVELLALELFQPLSPKRPLRYFRHVG
jgi:hypothetical protein